MKILKRIIRTNHDSKWNCIGLMFSLFAMILMISSGQYELAFIAAVLFFANVLCIYKIKAYTI